VSVWIMFRASLLAIFLNRFSSCDGSHNLNKEKINFRSVMSMNIWKV
jgi:hypothetical protein